MSVSVFNVSQTLNLHSSGHAFTAKPGSRVERRNAGAKDL